MWFQGGDGFFNEILNGLLSSRHKAPYPPTPTEVIQSVGNVDGSPAKRRFSSGSSNDGGEFLSDPNGTTTDTSNHDDCEPLLTNSEAIALGVSSFSMCHKFFYNPTPSLIWCPNVKYKTTLICQFVCQRWQEQELSLTSQVSSHMWHDQGDWFNFLYIQIFSYFVSQVMSSLLCRFDKQCRSRSCIFLPKWTV